MFKNEFWLMVLLFFVKNFYTFTSSLKKCSIMCGNMAAFKGDGRYRSAHIHIPLCSDIFWLIKIHVITWVIFWTLMCLCKLNLIEEECAKNFKISVLLSYLLTFTGELKENDHFPFLTHVYSCISTCCLHRARDGSKCVELWSIFLVWYNCFGKVSE